jgi:hypothetical protein
MDEKMEEELFFPPTESYSPPWCSTPKEQPTTFHRIYHIKIPAIRSIPVISIPNSQFMINIPDTSWMA